MEAYKFDTDIEEQEQIDTFLEQSERLIAVSRIFARARKHMNLAEQKTLVLALSQIRFTEEARSNIVYLGKKTLANIVGVHSDPNHLSVDLHNAIKELPKKQLY